MEDRDQAFHGVHVYVIAVCIYVCAGEGDAQALLHCVHVLAVCMYMLLEDTHPALLLAGHRDTGDTELLQPLVCQAV